MNLGELQSVRDRERQTDKLQQLHESFYTDAGELIGQLRTERERAAERADDPFDAPEVNRLTDEINTAEQTVEAIYEKRVGKVVKAASFAAADLPAEADGMTAEEQELFDTLVADIKQNRSHVLDVLAGEADEEADAQAPTQERGSPAESSGTTPPPESGTDPDVSAADLMGSGQEETEPEPPAQPPGTDASPATLEQSTPPDEPQQPGDDAGEPAEAPPSEYPVRNDGGAAAESGVERETVRITESVDTFVGSDDRDYDLDRDDVVTLPSTNARILVERDAAEQIE